MKYFKYWISDSIKITIGKTTENIHLVVGSNVSKEAASKDARIKAKIIEQRIADGKPKDDYDTAIKEHVSEIIDASNIITICRYGAKVLNTTEYTVLDLDEYSIGFFDFFKPLWRLTKKERIVLKFKENINRYPMLGNDFRIYETTKGIRVIGKKYIDPTDPQFSPILQKLNVDWLYIQLSRKQRCYRARLTPKPYRMRIKTIKIKTPVDCENEHYSHWSTTYEKEAVKFSVVRLLTTLGKDFSRDRVIIKHDQMCNEHRHRKLA